MKIKQKKKRRIVLKTVLLIVLTVLFVLASAFNSFISSGFANFYSSKIFPYVSMPAGCLNRFFHNSLTEGLVVCGFPLLAVGLISWFVIFIKKMMTKGTASYLYISYRNLMIILIVGSVIFQAMHGINYRRDDIEKELKLTDKEELTFEDYCAALKWAYLGMIEARSHLGEDFNGVAHMQTGFENTSLYACSLLDSFSDEYDIPLSRNYVRAKPVSLSHYWSYTGIVGMYDMFLGEANINTDDMNVTEFPATVCHELCHAKGYASETDCNLLATLACSSSVRADFRYSGFQRIFFDLYYMTEEIAEETGQVCPQYMYTPEMDAVFRDLEAYNMYWRSIDDEIISIQEWSGVNIEETSDRVNDTFLKSNGEEGIETYIVPDSIYVRFYLTHIAGK